MSDSTVDQIKLKTGNTMFDVLVGRGGAAQALSHLSHRHPHSGRGFEVSPGLVRVRGVTWLHFVWSNQADAEHLI